MKMGFVGNNLRTARIYRNMTIKELAEEVDVSKQAISQYERGDITPKADVLFRLVTKLQFPRSFFEDEIAEEVQIENTFFRALFSAKKLDLETQRTKTTFVRKIYEFLNDYLNLPQLDLPVRDFVDDRTPEEVAMLLRRYWKIGTEPVIDVVSLLERKGIIISSFATDSMSIDAFTQSYSSATGKTYCIVLGDDKNTYVRRNFDAAHELGHIMLHDGLSDVTEYDRVEMKEIENEANQFAAAFLMPAESFYIDLKNPTRLESYRTLKRKWRVSIGAMVMRAKQLNRINSTQYQNLYKSIKVYLQKGGEKANHLMMCGSCNNHNCLKKLLMY